MAFTDRPADTDPPATAPTAESAALAQAIAALMQPLARLAVARGMTFAAVEAALKQAFVAAAREAHPQLPPHRAVSRIATSTGLSRREVTRLTQLAAPPAPRRPLAAEAFARWSNDPVYRGRGGAPRRLPRQGDAPSFESLAQSVTRDVHPRSLLDELLRLGLAAHDARRDTVTLVRDAFVPRGDSERMLAFLGQNVGDHLEGAVANVLGDGRSHFEQAIFADELSAQSLASLRELIGAQWHALAAALVPAIQQRIDEDRSAGRAQDQRLRIGLYTFTDRMGGASAPAADATGPQAAAGGTEPS